MDATAVGARRRYATRRPRTSRLRREDRHDLATDLLVGAGAGLLASVVTGLCDRLLDPLISDEQRAREKLVRAGSPHQLAGPTAATKLLGRGLTAGEERASQTAFAGVYGLGWGLLHAAVRRQVPQVRRFAGLPFAVPFFLLCDGLIAPLLKLTPSIHRVPWQLDLKELTNHAAWTATAEMTHRAAGRYL